MIKFNYNNYRNVHEERVVTPLALLYLASPSSVSPFLSGYDPGWFIEAIAHDRGNKLRHFALSHIERGEDIMRFSLATEIRSTWNFPYTSDDEFTAYWDGVETAQRGDPFDFDRANADNGSAWAHGYNDGRRVKLGDEIDGLQQQKL